MRRRRGPEPAWLGAEGRLHRDPAEQLDIDVAESESRRWWGELWADRVVSSAMAEQAVDYGSAAPR